MSHSPSPLSSPSLGRVSFLFFHILLLQPTFSAAYSWVLTAPATQCSNLSISITGSDGVPPYRVLVIPSGPTPLPNDAEVRPIIDYAFDGNSTTASFAINYPANSQFVAVVSDARGFGTGGTSLATQVLESDDSSCYSVSNPYAALFSYYVGSDNRFTQCESRRIWWNASTVQGTPSFDVIIPGGQSFTIPESSITTTSTQGTGFSWTPPIEGGTAFILVAGDNHGMGSGGEVTFRVGFNFNDESCLNSPSPSSTGGTPAGIYSTSTTAGSSKSKRSDSAASSSGGIRTAALIGGIVGGVLVVLLIGILLHLLRRNAQTRRSRYPPSIDILGDPHESVTEKISESPVHTLRPTTGDTLSHYHEDSFIAPRQVATSETGSMHNYGPSQFGSKYNPPSEVSSSSRREQAWGSGLTQHKDGRVTLLPPPEERVIKLPLRYDNIGAPAHPNPAIVAQMHHRHGVYISRWY
ncbi:hypothetical protein F5887DRAFT_577813 [Amanita rubescens]|nr:hypothetical protein F5887DRAFT_577813 [Amanita rubescens]